MIDSYIVFDFETSGLDPSNHRIIQVGLCMVEAGNVTERDGWLVRQNVAIDTAATQIHGLTSEDLRGRGIPPAESLERLLARMGEAPGCIGHNIHRFDIPFLVAECRRLGFPAPATRDFIDTAALYKGWKLGMQKQSTETEEKYADRVLARRVRGLKYSIPVCVQELHITADDSSLHDASYDAYVTHLIYESLKPRLHARIR